MNKIATSLSIALALWLAFSVAADQGAKPVGDMGLFPAAEIQWGDGGPSPHWISAAGDRPMSPTGFAPWSAATLNASHSASAIESEVAILFMRASSVGCPGWRVSRALRSDPYQAHERWLEVAVLAQVDLAVQRPEIVAARVAEHLRRVEAARTGRAQ